VSRSFTGIQTVSSALYLPINDITDAPPGGVRDTPCHCLMQSGIFAAIFGREDTAFCFSAGCRSPPFFPG